jgi:DNA-binding transcriptional LysR family regulator
VNTHDTGALARRPDVDLDLRSLRSFVAAAEELHFTRAAERLYVAQQALSRDIRRLEEQLGVALFVRTTRRVTLTAEGERLLVRAREILNLHDLALAEVTRPGGPVLVDIISASRLTGVHILDAVRAAAPEREFRARYSGGLGIAIDALLAGRLDVALGRVEGIGRPLPGQLVSHVIRYEPLSLLLPADHPLAAFDPIPTSALAGVELDASRPGGDDPEWWDLTRQLLDLVGARATPPHPLAEGIAEQTHHLIEQDLGIVTAVDHLPVPGGVMRMISDPIPLQPWSIVYRRDSRNPGVTAVVEAARRLGQEQGWLTIPEGSWLPQPERSRRGT